MRSTSLVLVGLSCVAAILLPAGCSEESIDPLDSPGKTVSIDRPAGCNPLGATDACLFPFPSSFHEAADDASRTGVHLDVRQALLPFGGTPELDPSPYNLADGFSPVNPVLLHFGVEIDTTGLASYQAPELSLEEDAIVSLIDMVDGRRILSFVEMDANKKSGFDNRYAFIVRPIEPMEMGHRHALLIRRGLSDVDGNELAPTPAFQALLDGAPTDNEDVEAIRERTDAVLAFAETQGFEKSELLLAFDFQVASKEWLLGPVLSMREEALSASASGELAYEIETVTTDPNPDIAKIVLGTFEVPTYLNSDEEMSFEGDHVPVRLPANRSYPFTMLVPKRAETDGPLPLVVLGHGIFGNGRDFLTGGGDGAAIQALSNELGAIVIATDWVGLSTNDLPRIAGEVAPDLNRVTLITDQLQQALINAIVLTKLGSGALADDSEAKIADDVLVDPTRIYYWGASLGGIQGSSFISLSPDIARAAFGVPGSAWTTMLTRSIVFPPVKALLDVRYPDPLDLQFLLTMVQLRFDHSDPANMTRLMFKEPLPDAPPNRVVVLQEAIGDSQVPNLVTDILARAMGIKIAAPSIYQPFGIETVTLPSTESCVVQYRMEGWDDPFPPETNMPPDAENDVHHDMNFLPNAQDQIGLLFITGEIQNVCEGSCDPD
jgi:hypothetical protein